MDYLARQTQEQIENVMGVRIGTIPEGVLQQFSRDETVRALKQRIVNITGEAGYEAPRPGKGRGRS